MRIGPRSQKAPSAKRCIKTCGNPMYGYFSIPSQKAPSAKRCIKTWLQCECGRRRFSLRKHRAPKGALRLDNPARMHHGRAVRKHRAPKGALRLVANARDDHFALTVRKHRAPKGALRLRVPINIDTVFFTVRKHRAPKGALRLDGLVDRKRVHVALVRKHRAPKGALRQRRSSHRKEQEHWSERAERQKVH